MSELAQQLIDADRKGWEVLASGSGGEHCRTHLAPNVLTAFSLRGGVQTGSDRCD